MDKLEIAIDFLFTNKPRSFEMEVRTTAIYKRNLIQATDTTI